jgi:hypothetical protein
MPSSIGTPDTQGPHRTVDHYPDRVDDLRPDITLELAHVFGALRLAAAADTRSPRPSAADPVDRLEKLGQLCAQGLLTEEEFAKAKRKLLGEI